MRASHNGHLQVVIQLLQCKEIDVNVKDNVSEIVDFVTCISSSLLHIWMCFFFKLNVVDKNVVWRDPADDCFKEWTFTTGQSTVGPQRN